jgi:hypothetical protein
VIRIDHQHPLSRNRKGFGHSHTVGRLGNTALNVQEQENSHSVSCQQAKEKSTKKTGDVLK